jgi:hypothetical protein
VPDIPKRIHLGAITYNVTDAKTAIDAACREEGADLYGWTDHVRLQVALDPLNAPARQRETLLHEALHCVTEKAGIPDELGPKEEERLVRRLAPLLLDLIRTNPALVAYLTG